MNYEALCNICNFEYICNKYVDILRKRKLSFQVEHTVHIKYSMLGLVIGYSTLCKYLTLLSPVVSNGYTSKCSGPYWSNPPL